MWKIVISLVMGLVVMARPADAQFARQEMLVFESTTSSLGDFITGKPGTPVMLAGHLRLPKANEKNPVVILFHSGSGIGAADGSISDWERILNEAGIATFTIDAFTPRGILTFADVGRINSMTRIPDAYRALELLAKHRLIDANRIVVMGISHGATAALYSGLARFRKSHGNQDLRFAAHIALYPLCATAYREDAATDQRPMLVLHGLADNANSAASCRDYTVRLAKAGTDVRFIGYPDAHHMFDSRNLLNPVQLPQANTTAACHFGETDGGVIVNVATDKPPSSDDACLAKGLTFQYNEAAANKAHEAVLAFLKEVLALK